jgi:hypothetical protein
VPGEHGRRAIGGAEDVERGGLSVVPGEDRRGRLAGPHQRRVLRRDRVGELWPADGVAQVVVLRRSRQIMHMSLLL